MGATQVLGDRVATAPREWSERARQMAVGAFVDTLACAVAGAGETAPRHVLKGVSRWSGDAGVTVIGSPTRLPAPWAGLVAGTAAHALDYDDILEPANAHTSAALVPATIALGEEMGANGAACLDAYLIGIEVCGLIGQAMNMTHYQRGWHTTSTLGTLACAAACARLLGLDAERAKAAISISSSLAGGSKKQFGTMVKPMHAGLAAHNGILAATLAEAGTTAGEEVLEGDWGLYGLMAGNPDTGFEKAIATFGGVPMIEEYGLWQKPYPCCASNHQALDGLLTLRERHGLTPEAVAEVRVDLPEMYHRNLQYRIPRNPMEARFCLEYCLASALVDGKLGLDAFGPGAIARPELAPVIERITRMSHPDPVPANLPLPVTVTVHLADGSEFSEHVVNIAKLDRPALAAKFEECASSVLPESSWRGALDMLWDFESLSDIRRLTAFLER